MKRIIATGALAIALAGCGSDPEGTIETEDGEVEYSVDGAEGNIRFTGEDGETVDIATGAADADIDLPGGFTLYPGAEVVSTARIDQADGSGVIVMMRSADAPEKLYDFYRAQAEAAGVEIQAEGTMGRASAVGGESADGLTFSFNASPQEEGSFAQLVVGRGMD